MALRLCIPECRRSPAHPLHPPVFEIPLRIQIEGPTIAIERLLPAISWHTNDVTNLEFPQPAGPALASLAFQAIYGRRPKADDVVLQDEYLGWIVEKPLSRIDYYGVTFDHLVPANECDPEVLQINIIETENDGGLYANTWLPFVVNVKEFEGQKVLAVPRCCQKRRGTQDRERVNTLVSERRAMADLAMT
ncbi:hypothetical protein BKA67DRAFT_512186 [Truncatella angustata]|uniref:Uncharacterized protein n=1 Tax=Truncatella angustata TaxID=152316 RepID=A0A9P9A0P6_9PEZI|nr:uncharacterized protein BKA67DRAFT_512186 [Truncatella angustata]KAH6658637.1 hypothetical protein BKA67DRAFT_512186 [Truncatella angustata]